MLQIPSIRKNFAYRISYELLNIAIPVITIPYIARIFGPYGIGIYSYTASIIAYFVILAGLGTSSYGLREIAFHRENIKETSIIFWEIEIISCLTTGISTIFWFVFIYFSKEYTIYYLALTPLLIANLFEISWFYTGYEQVKYIVLVNASFRLVGVLLLFFYIKDESDLIFYIAMQSSLTLFGNLSQWLFLHKFLVSVPFKDLVFYKHFRETLVYFIPTIATSIYTIFDRTLIGLFTNDPSQNGYYDQALRLIILIQVFVFSALNSIMSARLSFLFHNNDFFEIKHRISQSLNFIFLLGYGCVFGLIGISHNFVPLFWGDGFKDLNLMICAMAPLIIIIGISNCLGSHYYTPSGRRSQSNKYIIIGAIVNLFFNLIFIPKFGAIGAILASLFAESVISFLYFINAKNFVNFRLLYSISWKKVIAGIIMGVLVYEIPHMFNFEKIFVLFLQILFGFFVYLIILSILKDDMLIYLRKEIDKFILN